MEKKTLHSDEALAIVIQYREQAKADKLNPEAQKVYDRAVAMVNWLANKHMPEKFAKE